MGTTLAGLARQTASHGHPFAVPCVLLSGGETRTASTGWHRSRASLVTGRQYAASGNPQNASTGLIPVNASAPSSLRTTACCTGDAAV